MSYVWGYATITVGSELPNINRVDVIEISPKNPKEGEEVSFTVRVTFDRKLPQDLRMEAVVTVTDNPRVPCDEANFVSREYVNAFAGFDHAQHVFKLRFNKGGTYKVCFGFKPIRYYSGPGR